jgi:hypothetical protein
MKMANTASRISTISDCTRSMNLAPAMLTAATSKMTAVVRTCAHTGAASSPKNSEDP